MPFPVNTRLTELVKGTSVGELARLYVEIGNAACEYPRLRRELNDLTFTLIKWHSRYVVRQTFFEIAALESDEACEKALEIIRFSFITVRRNNQTMITRSSMLPDDMRKVVEYNTDESDA
jgi:hypothetical protein